MKNVGTIKNHFGVGIQNTHPIFDRRFLAENVISLVESTALFVELSFLSLFGFSIFCILLKIDNMLSFLTIGFTDHFIPNLGTTGDIITRFIIMIALGCLFLATRRYFDWVKFNLHPRD